MPGTFGDWYDLAATNLGVAERRDSSGWRMLAGLGMLTGTVLGLVMAAEQVTVLKQLPWWRRLNLVFLPVAVDGAALTEESGPLEDWEQHVDEVDAAAAVVPPELLGMIEQFGA